MHVYAANGTLTKETNRIGQTTKYFYNDIGSKIREEFDIYKFYYLNHGELYQVKVANVTTVSYSYSTDGKFLLLQENYANDDTIRYTYNDEGDVTAQYKNNNANAYVTYTYNEDGGLTQKVNTETGLKYVYGENNSVSVYKLSDNTLVQSYTEAETEADEETGAQAYTTVTENHFGTNYSYVTQGKNLTYTAGENTVQFSYQTSGDEDEKVISDAVKYNNSNVLNANYTYDDNGNITNKDYGNSRSVTNTYDTKDRITSTSYNGKTYNYTYDVNSQLTAVSGTNYAASYAYDNRGNITSKTVNDTTTTFTYSNYGWKDLLVAVNGVELTYDENGNVLTYGDREYNWNTGRNLESIVDGEDEFSYTYDENGIRTSKTVNGVTTHYNTKDGVILSQTDGTNTMYFQYDTNGAPLGFIYNSTQYFYLTNQMGDVIAITDTAGTIVGNYEYDAWGMATLSDSDIANINPLRYRGYYYDNETGYYYLQSRYYDSNICRFLNADALEISKISKDIPVGTNLFTYCNNSPINDSDAKGDIALSTCVLIGIAVGVVIGGSIGAIYSKVKYNSVKARYVLIGAVAGGVLGGVVGYGIGISIGASATTATVARNFANSFKITSKISRQMGKRGWSAFSIDNTIRQNIARKAVNKATNHAATAYFTKSGAYVVIDNITKEIIQISNRYDPNWVADTTIKLYRNDIIIR